MTAQLGGVIGISFRPGFLILYPKRLNAAKPTLVFRLEFPLLEKGSRGPMNAAVCSAVISGCRE
jgi:hypothetical protein